MEAITFSQSQIHLLNMVSHIKTENSLELLKEQLSQFYADLIDIGSQDVHQKDWVRNPLRVAAVDANNNRKNTGAKAENHFAYWRFVGNLTL